MFAEKAMRLSQQDRIQPELGVLLGRLNMDMDWILSFSAKKEKSVSMMSENLWHICTLLDLVLCYELYLCEHPVWGDIAVPLAWVKILSRPV